MLATFIAAADRVGLGTCPISQIRNQAARVSEVLGLPQAAINRGGGGLARGHPIGASGAIALVRVLGELWRQMRAQGGAGALRGMACIAGASGLGTATWVEME